MMKITAALALGILVPAACFAGSIQETAGNAIREQISKEAPAGAAVNIEFIKPSALMAFEGAVSITASTTDGLSRKMNFIVAGFKDDKKVEVTVPVLVDAVCRVIVASRTLAPKSVIKTTDMAFADVNVAALNFMAFMTDDAGKLTGLRTAAAIQKSRVISPSDIESVPAVSRGMLVTIICSDDNMKMEVQGRAEEPGAVGQKIMVRNTNSKKLVMAKVVSGSIVSTGDDK
jgi:flagella basal body P-ring formation protein FlgA